jgi:plasmid stability protein
MSSITIRNLDPAIKERLRVRAAQHGHSMEAEARHIMQTALTPPGNPPSRNLYDRDRQTPCSGSWPATAAAIGESRGSRAVMSSWKVP